MNKEQIKRKLRIMKRKKWPFVLIALLAAILIALPVTDSAVKSRKRFSEKNPLPLSQIFIKTTDREKIKVIAHRGFSCQAPENTLPAIRKAAQYKFDTIEIDIRETQDGVWVLSHDEEINKTTDKKGRISDYTYYDLVTCTVDKGPNIKDYPDLKIPTLDEALKICLQYSIKPMIEIKDYTEDGIDKLVNIIDRNGFTKTCSVISFDRKALELVHKKSDDIRLYALVSKLTDDEIRKCMQNKNTGVSFNGNEKFNSPERIKMLRKAGIPLAAWTIDSEETMQKLFDAGVNVFVSNRVYKD